MSRTKYLLLWITVFGWITVVTSIDCSKAPSEALRIVCQQLQRWDDGARKSPAPTSVKPPSIGGKAQLAADFAPIASNMYQCMDIACLCVFFRGSGGASCTVQGRPLRKALRKEYRQLSDDERNRVHTAFRTIKSRVEIALRQVDPEIALPYWDSTLDGNMPNSKDSIMWTNEFMGETAGGGVSGGPFREWRTLEGRPNIRRDVGAKGKCFSEDEIQFMMGQTDISQVLAFTAPKQGCPFQPNFNVLEYTHGNPHIYVGGEMYDQATAGNDPVFYMHHSFVDYIWEMWRQSKQTTCTRILQDRVVQWVITVGRIMIRGFRYLYCDRSHGQPRCASKIKPGGSCAGLSNGEDACYNGRCQGERCVAQSTHATPPPPIAPTKPVVVVQQTCFNEHECCSYWSGIGECPKNYIYMSEWCKASCRVCQPNYDLNNECQDRHPNCATWARGGECNKNPLWMSENCRSACGKCGIARSVVCSGGGGGGGGGNQGNQGELTVSLFLFHFLFQKIPLFSVQPTQTPIQRPPQNTGGKCVFYICD
ncbi:shTK domain protein [Ancylostoma duodenale]|uniref:ShTK domain protein n=1 Tax=Ancylostoma duodenale TaxID=51022 RepID=A0A0C2DDH5_9BILA|nr:shTK domain protein [Ancylostoma duodenale]